MDEDDDIYRRINSLAAEEERLWAAASDGSGMGADDRQRLHDIQIRLDQSYDLLRQRAAKRSVGDDPREAEVRAPEVVENYEQ